MAIYVDHILKFDSTVLAGLTAQPFSRGGSVTRPLSDGLIDSLVTAQTAGEAGITFSTLNVDDAFGLSGLRGAAVTNVVSWSAARTAIAKSGSSAHVKRTIATGLLLPESISCQHGDNAVFSGTIAAYNSSGADPVVVDVDQALGDASSGGATKLWTLGGLTVNGSAVGGLRSMAMSFGASAVVEASDSAIYPKLVVADGHLPTLEFETDDLEFADTVGGGLALTGGGVVFYLRRRSGVGFAADGSTVHIKFTAAEGVILPGETSGARRQAFRFVVHPQKPTASDPIVIATGSAIT